MAKKLQHRYTFTPSSSTIVIEGNIHRRRLLLITNVTTNQIIYNFADPNLTATSITFDSDSEETTIVLTYDTVAMSSSDTLQIFVEEDGVEFRPTPTYTDPVSKFRVSEAQTLIDTDFEYGLQYTKWETVELVNNIPGFYSSTGDTPLNLTSITGNSGSDVYTVTAVAHGLLKGTPFDVRGLNQSNLDGSYVVASVAGEDSFTFVGRATSNVTGDISGAYTYLVPGKFYEGSQINYARIETNAATPSQVTVTTTYPNGFSLGTQFYVIDSLGSSTLIFDSSLVTFAETQISSQTFDPNSDGTGNGTAIRKTDIWDYTGTLNSRYLKAGVGGNVATNSITLTSHGYSDSQAVVVLAGPNSTLPTGITEYQRYYIVSASANSFSLSTTVGGGAISITADSGSGIFSIHQGYVLTNVRDYFRSGRNNIYDYITTWQQDTSATATSVPLVQFASSGNGGTIYASSSPAALTGKDKANLYNGTAPGFIYFGSTGTTQRTLNSGPSASGSIYSYGNVTSGTPNPNVFVPVVANSSGNSIYIPNHGFLNNEQWTYSSGGGTAIGGLTNGTTYYIDLINSNQFGFKTSTVGSRINLTDYAATGVAHSIYTTVDNPLKNTIYSPAHGLQDGTEVVYSVGTGSTIGGLTDGLTYFVRDATTDRFRLALTQGGTAIDLTSAGIGTNSFVTSAEGVFDGTYTISSISTSSSFVLSTPNLTINKVVRTFDPQANLFVGANFINIPVHRFATGTAVTYSNGGGTSIGGIGTTSTYYVIRLSKDSLRLASTQDNAVSGIGITFTSTGSGTQHTLTTASLNGEIVGLGTIALTNQSTLITGTGTKFNQTFKSGDPIVVGISSTTVYETTVQSVLSDTELVTVGIATTTIFNTYYLNTTSLYVKSNSFGVHRPFDGGVEINAGYNADSQIVRQTRRYFRYQSGKGLSSQFAINFNPPLDISSLTGIGTTATVVTRYPHGLSTSQTVSVRDATVSFGPNYYNGTFQIKSIVDSNTFTYEMGDSNSATQADGFPQLIVKNWGGSRLRAGMFDFQNGMFYEYDGSTLYTVRRDSTSQLGGTISVTYGSNLVTGSGSNFLGQLSVGDMIVIRGQSYKVVNIPNNSAMYVQPAYRGTTNSNIIASKTVDTRVAQDDWSIDPCDGTGETGYVLDVTRIQMAYMDYSWYGAGKIRFGFKDQNGEVIYVNEYKHNNKKNEAFMRSGNLPARYEIQNIGSPAFAPSLAHWGTTVQMDGKYDSDDAYLFTASSPFLTFSGSTTSSIGSTNTNYTYVNPDGSTVTGLTTYTTKTVSSFSANNDTLTINSHGYTSGQYVQYFATTTINGLTIGNFYYVIVATRDTIKLTTTYVNAISGTNAVNLTNSPSAAGSVIRSNFAFNVAKTSVTGFGSRIIHRYATTLGGLSNVANVVFGTQITSSTISPRGTAYIYRVIDAGANQAFVDFFFQNDQTDPLATTNVIPSVTSASAITHTVGTTTPVPSLIPLISLRLSPSVDGGITGAVGNRDIINRMQLTLDSLGVLTTHDAEIRLILNSQLDNVSWTSQGIPSLSEIISHNSFDNLLGGVNIFSFRATGNSPDSLGRRTANAFSADISSLLSLGNCILGGDGVFPNGPDVLTIAAAPLNTTGITVNSPMSISARLSWSESQA